MSTSAKRRPEVISPENDLEAFSVDLKWIQGSQGLRFDASHYNPRLARALELLRETGMELVPLGEVTERIFIPPRCRRVYVEQSFGVPFVQGSHVVHFQPADLKYVSKTAQKKLDELTIKAGWLLVTRSGTIGRVTITPEHWDGWAASEHILRIIPKENSPCPHGYIYSFLSSPPGQAQLTSQIYGAVVDELTEDQTRSVLIPVPSTREEKERTARINELALESMEKKEEAVELNNQAIHDTSEFLNVG